MNKELFGLLKEGKINSNQNNFLIEFLFVFSDKQPIVRHENFRLFGCMNPASDVGKRDIPIGIRNRFVFYFLKSFLIFYLNRFTELFVDECDDRSEFVIIVDKYLSQTNIPREYIDRIVTFYIDIQMKVKNFLLTSSSTSNNRIAVTYRLQIYSFEFF